MRRKLAKRSFAITDWYFIHPETEVYTSIELPSDMRKRMAEYLRVKTLFDGFCCFDFVNFLYGKDTRPKCTTFYPVDEKDVCVGTVVVYTYDSKQAIHVGIYLGNNMVISKNGGCDNILVNTLEDMKVFYEYHSCRTLKILMCKPEYT